jgi:hypothetical protein
MSSFSFARFSVQERALLLRLTQNPRRAFRHALDLDRWDGDETTVVKMHSGNGEHDEMDRRAIARFDHRLLPMSD